MATRGRREDAWRLEPEGETETLEAKVVSKGVEGAHVDPHGEEGASWKFEKAKRSPRERR